jgi:catechol 2,3-dioxygenase-like lactoylglutathione lyase family enzyme
VIDIKQIDHIVLRTGNPGALIDFYCTVLGCTVERTLPEEMGLIQLRAGEALIDIVAVDSELGRQGGGAPGRSGNNLDHFCFQIQPLAEDDLRNHLRSHGIEAGEFAKRYGAQGFGRSVYIRDPDGNTVELKFVKTAAGA